MDKIVLRQSSIVINNYEQGDCPKLEYTFSIYDPMYHVRFPKGIEYIKEKKQAIIPRGVDIRWVEGLFMQNAVLDKDYDDFESTGNIMIKTLPRDDVQKQALRFMIGEGEYQTLKSINQKCLCLNTGAGKTYVTVATISYLCIKSIIITSSVNWLEQWKKCISQYTDIKPNEIYFISGSASINRLLKRDISKYKIFLASHNTIKSYGDTNGWNSISDLFKYLRIGIKVFDEAHLNFANVCQIDFHTNTFMTFYVTATPARSNEEENIIYGYYFKNIPAIDLFDQEEDPRTQYIAYRYNSRPTPQEISNCKGKFGLDRNKYIGYIVEKDNFHKMLHILMDRIKKTYGKVLIYIGTNSSIEYVYDWIKDNYPEMLHLVGIYTSIVTENKKEQLDKKIILSTTKSCGAAMDIKGLKMTIVLAEPFKSEVLARQTLGRTRDKNTIYIDIVDDGFFYTKRYYEYKKPIFGKYATKCTEVKISDAELSAKSNNYITAHQQLIYPLRYEGYDFLVRPIIYDK